MTADEAFETSARVVETYADHLAEFARVHRGAAERLASADELTTAMSFDAQSAALRAAAERVRLQTATPQPIIATLAATIPLPDPVRILSDALAEIARLAAHGWTEDERTAVLARINEIALGASSWVGQRQ